MKSPVEEFLKEFHKKNPGCTPTSFLYGKTNDGRTSYDRVAQDLLKSPVTVPLNVLDLACGDGILLEILFHSNSKNLNLFGVDMSPGELNAAKARLASKSIQLFEARAQELPFENDFFDFTFCHLALMLMEEADQVLTEVHRVLKPSGIFSAVIGGSFIRTPIMTEFGTLLGEFMKSENAISLSLGDPRIRSAEEIKPFFEKTFAEVKVEDFEVTFAGQPEELMGFFMGTYQVATLSAAGQERLREELLKKLKAQTSAGGLLRFPFALRQITAVKSRS
jgi:ubiquinone/menaquinone biosynthesis C-methylase UbiE